MAKTKRHKVFISYYHEEDQGCKRRFAQLLEHSIVDRSLQHGGIDSHGLSTEALFQSIREDYIADATVTVVLIGHCTWQRKYVDWEIGASLRDTQTNPRCGLLGILLPPHPDFGKDDYRSCLIPPRLADNCGDDDSFASIYDWSDNPAEIRNWIHTAFLRRKKTPYPNNGRELFGRNWKGDCSNGWQR